MCVIVRASSNQDAAMPRYDRDNVALVISDRLTPEQALTQVRAILAVLGAPQGCHTPATCWCGDAVRLPAEASRPAYAYAGQRHA